MLGMGQMGCSGETPVNWPSQETYESVEVITVSFHDGLNASSFHADYELTQISPILFHKIDQHFIVRIYTLNGLLFLSYVDLSQVIIVYSVHLYCLVRVKDFRENLTV